MQLIACVTACHGVHASTLSTFQLWFSCLLRFAGAPFFVGPPGRPRTKQAMGSVDAARILALEEYTDGLEKRLLKIMQQQQQEEPQDALHQMQRKLQQLEAQIRVLLPDSDPDPDGYFEDFAQEWALQDPDHFREKFELQVVRATSAQGDAEGSVNASSGQVRDAEVVHAGERVDPLVHCFPRWKTA